MMKQETSIEKPSHKLIHVARIQTPECRYLFLRRIDRDRLVWFEDIGITEEKETSVSGNTVGDALWNARRFWKEFGFRTVNCGFRYTLPERDEHGDNALFHQMIASYSSFNGVYFDEDLGHNCFINFASLEALALWKRVLKTL